MRKMRLDVVIAALFPELSRSRATGLIREDKVSLRLADGSAVDRVKPGTMVAGGEFILIADIEREPLSAEPEEIPLDVRYEDETLLVVNKPAGLVVHPAPGHVGGTLVNALAAYCRSLSSIGGEFRPGIVHRLDKDTSGLLIVAKNDAAHAALASQLAARTISREYWALVWGLPSPSSGRIEAVIGRDRKGGKTMAVDGRAGRSAATRYDLLDAYPYASLLSLHLETGRTHQIRVHMKSIGHPVVGDAQYGGRELAVRGISPGHRGSAHRLLADLPRQALHARRISFVHPATSLSMTVEVEIPDDFAVAVKRASGIA
jgi:23S rRNA pseudouridine1911/1915/1917 synthase